MTFRPRSAFASRGDYRLLPFRFARLSGDRYVAVNDVGEFVTLDRADLVAFIERTLPPNNPIYRALKARHFLMDGPASVALDLLVLKHRSRAELTAAFTGLHIFVVTLRCDLSCQYCQVSRQSEERARYDMSEAHADKAVDLVFRSPNQNIKIEFQGGEPLLHFSLIRRVVETAVRANAQHRRNLQFVIASNLSRLDGEMLSFCREHGVHLSTSLDGPADLHDAQRPSHKRSSHAHTVEGIRLARSVLGPDAVSALMTTTPASMERVEEIIEEYVRLGFHGIFLRSLSPYGFAARSLVHKYGVEDWLRFYRRGLDYILQINRRGFFLREEATTILLQKMLSPMGSSYVDLQSPAGIGIGALVYNYDGAIYASDEGRMLAEMGDESFRLGHMDTASYEQIMTSDALMVPLSETMLEGSPMCSDCAFAPFCGADPVFHRSTQGDFVGHKAFSAFCGKQMGMLRHLLGLLEESSGSRDILLQWAAPGG